ncbi:MAG: DNA primase [Bacteroidetes bacterium]|nr:DNA primase [Bacteroidota bacterium]
MIKKETIDVIVDSARIEEVVGDFVQLKRRGSGLLGLCPFHNEKTPSFNVSPSRGIFKCFGCGKAGNSINFIMEHEHYSYPEALRYLAQKYNITIEEDEQSPEFSQEQLQRESLLVVSEFAKKFFIKQLHETDEGKSIGLSYFHEREFTEAMIDKFQLGYSPDSWRALTDNAIENGFQKENLIKAGLSIANEDKMFDRFRGRVMFPIHNITGKVIGFGARILKTDPKAAKYLNSPETEIYNKSKILYGIFFAKKSIIAKDDCLLVEGYTDVIALHQVGIENVVASSGTSLTIEQIRLIGRYTKNITVLYDGDPAGIKASLRGIDLILEEGLNVKVVLFPDGDDPDSFARKHNSYEVAAYISEHAHDFIRFKTSLLLKDVANDPVRRAGLIRDIVETIAKIPDPIIRSTYTKECSVLMEINENVLIAELNKIIRKSFSKQHYEPDTDELMTDLIVPDEQSVIEHESEFQEAEIIRLLLLYGEDDIYFIDTKEGREPQTFTEKMKSFIIQEFGTDKLQFENVVYNKIFEEFTKMVHSEMDYQQSYFVNHADEEIRKVTADFLTSKYSLAQWSDRGVAVKEEVNRLKHAAMSAIYSFKIKVVTKRILQNRDEIKKAGPDDNIDELLKNQIQLDKLKSELSEYLSIVVLK